MARYHGPKARINRRLGFQVYESHGAIKAMERDNAPLADDVIDRDFEIDKLQLMIMRQF